MINNDIPILSYNVVKVESETGIEPPPKQSKVANTPATAVYPYLQTWQYLSARV